MPIGAIVTVTDIQVNDQFDDAPFGNAASIIRLPGGGFAVFWSENTANDGSGGCVQGRFFDVNGVPTSPQFIVNTSTNGTQAVPDAVLLADGNIMISWTDNGLHPGDTSGGAVRARVIDQTGATVVAEFLVNTTTTLSQSFPTSILLADGNVMIVWQDLSLLGGDASGSSIKGQVVTAAGVKVGGEFLINTETAGNQNIPQLTLLTNGNVVVTWQDTSGTLGDAQGASVKAQILDASGNKIGGEFLVNTSTFDAQNNMEITALDNGNFIITWQDRSLTGGDAEVSSIKAQIFSATGTMIGGEFLVNTTIANSQTDPAIVELSNGQIVIAWRDTGPTGTVSVQTIRAQVFNADGSRHGSEIIASTVGENFIVGGPAIEDLGDGRFVITAIRNEVQGTTQVPRGLFANIFTVLGQVTGTPDADTLTGSAGADAIEGLAGNDVITGLGGGDVIDAGDGDDQVSGGDGNDIIVGGSGVDIINGGAGDDQIHGGLGNDVIDGGSGNNEIFGDEGDDQISNTGGSANIYGGDGNDTINASGFIVNGEDGNDTITATGGVVFMQGGLGDDTLTNLFGSLGGNLYGDQGNDILRIENASGNFAIGGDGDDDITVVGVGGFANNSVNGDAGNDVLRISGGGSVWLGTGLNQVILLSAGGFVTINEFNGGEAGDVIDLSIFGPNPFGPGGRLTMSGSPGVAFVDDSVTGMRIVFMGTAPENLSTYNLGVANPLYAPVALNLIGAFNEFPDIEYADELVGADGDDTISGAAGADLLFGGGGNDNINGGTGNDTFRGGTGNDTLIGGGGVNAMFGDAGNDQFNLAAADSGSTIDGGIGTDRLLIAGAVSLGSVSGIEAVELVSGGTLTLSGSQFTNGLAFNTALSGNGSIVVNMESGSYFFASSMAVAGGSAIAFTVNGTTGSDVMKGSQTASNTFIGGDGADQLRGGGLADTIDGGAANDKIMGLGGADQLTGGAGADQFRYLFAGDSGVGAGNRDVILDFAAGSDRLDFRVLDANLSLPGRQTLSFLGTGAFTSGGTGQVRYEVSGGDLLVQVDLDGNGTADMEMLLQGAGAQTLTGTDFLF